MVADDKSVLVHNGTCFDPATLSIDDAHIVANHTPEGMFANDPSKTHWLPETTKESRAAIIKDVLTRGQEVTNAQNRDGIVMEFTYEEPIGTKIVNGGKMQDLFTMRVCYDPANNFVRNAFPVG